MHPGRQWSLVSASVIPSSSLNCRLDLPNAGVANETKINSGLEQMILAWLEKERVKKGLPFLIGKAKE